MRLEGCQSPWPHWRAQALSDAALCDGRQQVTAEVVLPRVVAEGPGEARPLLDERAERRPRVRGRDDVARADEH